MDLNNEYYSLIPTQDFSYSSAKELMNRLSVDREIEKLREIYDFGRAFKISMASLIQRNPLSYVKDMLPIKIRALSNEVNMNQEFIMLMRYINQSMLNRKDQQQNNFVVSNIFKLSDSEIYEKEDNDIY